MVAEHLAKVPLGTMNERRIGDIKTVLNEMCIRDRKKTFTKELSFRDVIVYEHNRQKHPQYSETMKKDKQYWDCLLYTSRCV